jgi:hypothetical protein
MNRKKREKVSVNAHKPTTTKPAMIPAIAGTPANTMPASEQTSEATANPLDFKTTSG